MSSTNKHDQYVQEEDDIESLHTDEIEISRNGDGDIAEEIG